MPVRDYSAFVSRTLDDATIPELPRHYRGKVRDNYDLADGRRVIIASDRLSAFDRILCTIPFKGQILTQTARFWFEETADICANHVIEYPDPNVLICRRLDILPVEIVVRDYLAGTTDTSILKRYKAGQRSMYGMTLPDGMRDNERLAAPVITPTSKEFDGGHDEPLTPAEILERGLILADTKYEFGVDGAGRIVLADEIHTPDSSRYWRKATYQARFEAGERPDSFDKDFVRSWVAARCDPYKDAIPAIPADLIVGTTNTYAEAFETITGRAFEPDLAGATVLERIRERLAPLFGAA